MSCAVIRMERDSVTGLEELADKVTRDLEGAFVAPELAYSELVDVKGVQILLMIWERFYMRNGSMTAVTVQVTDDGEKQEATIAGTGGGEGLLNISLGANSDFASKVADSLGKCGFAKL